VEYTLVQTEKGPLADKVELIGEPPKAESEGRCTGTVEWFNDEKGYGFIVGDDDGEEIFVHFKEIVIKKAGFRTLESGQKVEYDLVQSENGARAFNVKMINLPSSQSG